jgi:lipopolysaccharide exporter
MTAVAPAQVRGALGWSTISTLILRVGTFIVGIVLARILTPEQFGVFAVALTVQAVLMTLADLGLSADLIRSDHPERIAPTVATFGLLAGVVMTAGMALSGHTVAELLGSPEAGSVIVVLSFTLLLGGAGLVPYAMLQRRFQQKRLFVISAIDFVLGTTVTLLLLWNGWGVMALAIGRVAAQAVTVVLQFVLSGERPRYGVDRAVVRPVLSYGLPIAAANLLSWALLNIDNVVIARISGPVALGFYFLAFNISSWPMTALGQIVRSVALPTFSRTAASRRDPALATATALTGAVAVPAGAFLALLCGPLIVVVYGDKWAAATPVLAALGLFGALRAVFDVIVSYLLARGASRAVLRIQVLWFVLLVPATVAATMWWGITGAAWAHLGVSVVIVLPAYLLAAKRVGGDVRLVLANGWQPVAAMIPAAFAVVALTILLPTDLLILILGGLTGGVVYAALIFRWVLRRIPRSATPAAEDPSPSLNVPLGKRQS